jgi:FKBP-type peptidyl-prolyl cis-trans isomerase FkpA
MRALIPDNRSGFYYVSGQTWNGHIFSTKEIRKPHHRLLLLACLCLGACGGGGGGSGGSASTSTASVNPPVSVTPPPAPTTLASYVGTWYGPCLGRVQDTARLTPAAGGANAVQLNLVRNFHASDNCSGDVAGAETLSADFSLAYGSTTTAGAILSTGAAATQVPLDLVTISIPAYTRTRSGPAVTTSTNAAGVRTWCIAYADGPLCSTDAGPQPAATAAAALTLDKGDLVMLSPTGSGYAADARYTKERATAAPGQGPAFERIDTVQGTGTLASSGRTLTVNYTGWLYDAAQPGFKGTQFDTSVGKTPFTFRLGAGQVIAGWDQGLLGMRAGGKRTLIIPAAMAYGRAGSGTSIPPDAPLIFEVDLVTVQ